MLLPSTMLLPGRTLSGAGSLTKLGVEAAAFGPRGLLVHGRALASAGRLTRLLATMPRGIAVEIHAHEGGEPTLDEVEALRARMRALSINWVAAVGGGSVIDLAKAAAGLLDAPRSVGAYQAGEAIPPATLPLIAVPTTAGTGSEATVVSVLTDAARGLKQSIRHPTFMPRLVILDPELLHGCPPDVLAASGMDAFVQAFESYTSRGATPFTRVLSELALTRIARALPAVHGGDWSFAADLLEGSYVAGLALSHARLGVVHGLAHPLGARWQVAHGLACAACFPAALRFNQPVIADDLNHLRGCLGCGVEEWLSTALSHMGLRSPFAGQPLRDVEAVVAEVLASGSTAANPRPVTADDARALLAEVFSG